MTDNSEELNVLIGSSGAGNRDRIMTARLQNGKPQCQGEAYRKVGRFGGWGQCVRGGTYLEHATDEMRGAESDKLYYFCASHAPSKVAERNIARNGRWDQQEAANKRKWNRHDATQDILKALRAGDMEAAMAAFARHEANVDPS